MTAPTPTFSATSRLFSSSGFFSSIIVYAFSIHFPITSSRNTTLPFRVDIVPSSSDTMP